ncbi:MAG: leucine-rich repeat protein [Bacteroidales bacterium]|nr:leucine-rich repeat protein [Bacteroidales bacterium]
MKRILLSVISTLLAFSISAHDIEQINDNGDIIWYNITSPTTVSVTYEGASIAAFVGEYFGDIVIPASIQYEGITYDVTGIEGSAMYNCQNLTSVVLPNTIESIGFRAFGKCSSLTSVTISNSTTTVDDIFYNCPSTLQIHVPCGAGDTYRNAEGWSGYANYIVEDCSESGSGDNTDNTENNNTESGDSNGETESGEQVEIPSVLNDTICAGDTYSFGEEELTTSGTYRRTITKDDGTEFTQTLNLIVKTPVTIYRTATLCRGEKYVYLSDTITTTGSYTYNYDCDSTVIIAVSFSQNTGRVINATICQGSQYELEGQIYTTAGTHIQTYQNSNGCEDTIFLNLKVNTNSDTTINATICQGQTYTENGFNVSQAGTYQRRLSSYTCCDSLITLNLNVTLTERDLDVDICEGESYTIGNNSYTESIQTDVELTTLAGCDSIIHLTLNVHPNETTTEEATICEGQSYTWHGQNYLYSGFYILFGETEFGCEKKDQLDLTVIPKVYTTVNQSICQGESFELNGETYNATGVYIQTTTNESGCEDITIITLQVNQPATTIIDTFICGTSYEFGNQIIETDGVYYNNLQTEQGCDSTVVLDIEFHQAFDTLVTATIPEGQTYTEYGFNVSEAGTYTITYPASNYCDSTITLVLNVESGLTDIQETNIPSMNLYPNPVKTNAIVQLENLNSSATLFLADVQGRIIKTYNVRQGETSLEIETEKLANGVYELKLVGKDIKVSKHFVKE